ncbi:uncharacterized protein BP5553_01560 [Venustampulla echinocandica]|uniref:Uncharacterized protein n=1 Tax=Venustampulla echinocandica TaxID=2656787 RepID=A0A370U1D1_9HELO|nr:uncharacterized protein BP5553_01560 [Venustampulla echinocandica]RDL41581.1 hypothetical protein BP5553_01560 [Venustampulla echinocandica]
MASLSLYPMETPLASTNVDCYCANYYSSTNCHNTVPKFGDRCPRCVDQLPTPHFCSFSSHPTPACLQKEAPSEDIGYFQVVPGARGGGDYPSIDTETGRKGSSDSDVAMNPTVECIEDINDPEAGPVTQRVRGMGSETGL